MANPSKSPATDSKPAKKAPRPFDPAALAEKCEKMRAKLVKHGKRVAKENAADTTLPALREAVAGLDAACAKLRSIAPKASGAGF